MNKFFATLILLVAFNLLHLNSTAQDSLNMTKLGQLDYTAQLSNIWGYATEDSEYALVGTRNGMSLVDVTVPSTPTQVYFKTGPISNWREIKTFADHAYVVTEGGGGLQIIDMSPLPQNTNLSSVSYTGSTFPFTSAHTLYIDENGILYIFGSDYGQGGAIIYDLNGNPSAPVELGVFDDYYIHDGFVRGDTLWASSIYDGFLGIVDVSDKANPFEVTSFNTPSNFTHNSWPTDNNNYLFTTDEVSNAYVGSYDVSDFGNITEVDRFQHYPGSNSIPHNAHLLGDFLYVSYYKDGVVVVDVSDPANLVESGFYDTAPTMSGNGFDGCWGVYPYLPSGNIIASDMSSGLWILGFNNAHVCYLEGTVTDFSTGDPLNGVTVEILTTSGLTATDLTGDYATGFANAGSYSVRFSLGGYITQTINNVVLTIGNTTILDVQLIPDVPFNFTGQVVDDETGAPVPNALVKMQNDWFSFNLTADGNGFFTVSQFYAGVYEIVAGKWGYKTECNDFTITSTTTTLVELTKGIYDDFTFNFGWTETNTSPTGQWERGVPVGTEFEGDEGNPGYDVEEDCLDLAFVTGNDGGSAGDDDVDDGNAVLTSPVFDLLGYNSPILYYSRWFFNGGGNGDDPNDSLIIELSNGQETVLLERISESNTIMSQWVPDTVRVMDYLSPTNAMTLKITVTDFSPGHLVEAGIDLFYIMEGWPEGLQEQVNMTLKAYPNPASGNFTIEYTLPAGCKNATITLHDVTGKTVFTSSAPPTGKLIINEPLSTGIYLVKLQNGQGNSFGSVKVLRN